MRRRMDAEITNQITPEIPTVFSSTELGTGKIRTVPLLSLRLFPPHNALSLVTSFLSRNGRFYIAGPTS